MATSDIKQQRYSAIGRKVIFISIACRRGTDTMDSQDSKSRANSSLLFVSRAMPQATITLNSPNAIILNKEVVLTPSFAIPLKRIRAKFE
jgi:hypothetical protein